MPAIQTHRTKRNQRFNLRATRRQEEMILAGAAARGVSVTDFIVESACLHAEQTLADRREFVASPAQWKAFVAALDRPARTKSALTRLFTEFPQGEPQT